jgi:hypothetical protein
VTISDAFVTALDLFAELPPDKAAAFTQAISLYYSARLTWTTSLSLALAGLISSIETLAHFDNHHIEPTTCSLCGQKNFSALAKFRVFLEKYGSVPSTMKKHYNELYDLRSKILHQGQLLVADMDHTVLASIYGTTELDKIRRLTEVVRICLFNWLILSHS